MAVNGREDALREEGKPPGRALGGLPLLQGLLPLHARQITSDVLAGVTLAALAVPEVMGYSRIAGTPVVTGLYTLLLPVVLFALFGSSRHLVVGADSATAAIMASTLATLAQPASAEWMQMAGILAVLCAALLFVARLARLAFLADFLSRTVLVGFLTGVGLQVALGEIPGVLGLHAEGGGAIGAARYTVTHLHMMQGPNAAIGVGVVLAIFGLRAIDRRLPAALIAIAAALAVTWWFDLQNHGVSVIGRVPGGLPSWTLPDLGVAQEHIGELMPSALAMAFVILAQSAATSRAYAWRHDENYVADRDVLALGLANAGAALTGAFVVNGSPTKTQMVDSAGGRSQLAQLTMAAIVLLILLFFTGPIAYLPASALAGVVFLIGVELVNVGEMRKIHAARRSEFWIATLTAAAVVVAGVERAIVLAMALSLIDHVRRGYRPHNSVVVRGEDGHAKLEPVADGQEYAPGLTVYRFSHSMYYANAEVLSREVAALAAKAQPPLRWFVIDMDAVDDVDFSAGAALLALQRSLAARHIALKFLRVAPALVDQLRRYGVLHAASTETEMFTSVRHMRHEFEASAQPA